jgi:polyisoprenyl-teichoic acid--peptidoglycan teichoic acid transferase
LIAEPREGPAARSPALATFLSFLWPGLGQLYVGARRSALIFGLPLLLVVVVVALQATGGLENLAIELLTPSTALTVLILLVLLGAWRLVSMGDALSAAGRNGTWRRPVPVASFLALAAIVIVTHVAAANVAWSFYTAGKDIFVGVHDPDGSPRPSGPIVSAAPGASVAPSGSAAPNAQPRLNILLTGIDSNQYRSHALNDTLLVVSVDQQTGDVVMVSFPRDMARLPTPDGKTYRGKINSIQSYADRHPELYPNGGMAALTDEIGYLLGAPVDYYASVDLEGFTKLIDRVGGVTVDVTEAIDDPSYGGWDTPGRIGFHLTVGRHTFDGPTALAYVRSRKGIGNSDFGRARRQQQLLVALERKLIDPAMIPNLPGILDAATKTLKTNFPPDQLSQMLALGRRTKEAAIKRYVLSPPYTKRPAGVTDTYILVPDMARFAKLSIALFGSDSRYWSAANPG